MTTGQFYANEAPKGCLVVLAALCGSQDSMSVQHMLNEERAEPPACLKPV